MPNAPRPRLLRALCPVALAALVLGGLVAAPLHAQGEANPMRRVDFAVVRGADVENDRARAVLSETVEDGDARTAADQVNEAMAWALAQSQAAEGVSARTGSYQTFPVTREGKIRRWRARQELVLESNDLPALTQLMGTLQERLQLDSIGFTVSPELRRETEQGLISEALAAYQERADRIRASLGAGAYELVHLSVDTDGASAPRPYAAEMARGMAQAASMAPPAFEGGTSRVNVAVHATIELAPAVGETPEAAP